MLEKHLNLKESWREGKAKLSCRVYVTPLATACFPTPQAIIEVGDSDYVLFRALGPQLAPASVVLFPSNTFLFIYIFMYCIFLYKNAVLKLREISSHS